MVVPMPAVIPERMEGAGARELPVSGKRSAAGKRRVGVSQVHSGEAGATSRRVSNVIECVRALAVDRGLECRSARMTDVRGRRTRTQAPGVDPAAVDPAAAKMWRRVGGEMGATHAHGATAEMRSAAAHVHAAAAKMGATAATTEVSAATAAANMSATTAAAETASRVSSSRQAKR
jgi:hypothetical protein